MIVEMTNEIKGYEEKDLKIEDAVELINSQLENKRSIFIDGRIFMGNFITIEDLEKCKKKVSITNALTGG